MKSRVVFQSNSDEWSTPQDVFDELNAEFGFNLDPCAFEVNYKCDNYFTKEDNGLEKSWGGVQSLLQSPIQPNAQVGREVLPGRVQG